MTNKYVSGVILIPCLSLASIISAHAECNPNIPTTKPNNLYTDNGDETVTDQATGLMWKQCSEGLTTSNTPCDTGMMETYTWNEALQHAATTSFAGYSDWRLPNKNELASLVELKCVGPAINATLFPNTYYTANFWSSSPSANRSESAWTVEFYYGSVVSGISKSSNKSVRLVRNE